MLYQFDATWNLVKFGFTDSRQCGDDQGETFSNVSLFRDCVYLSFVAFRSPLTWLQLLSLCFTL